MKFFLIILGWSWIILGVWWFLWPGRIRKRFARGYRKKMRRLLVVVFFVTVGTVFSVGRGIEGWLGTLFVVVAVIALIKGLFCLQGKLTDRALDWWERQPDSDYRIAAAGVFVLGCLTQWVFKLD